VLGPSGSGKTTLLRLLAGLDRPSAGTIRVFGTELGKLAARRLDAYRAGAVGYIDQHYVQALAPELSVRELVGLQLGLAGEPRGRRDARALELLGRVGLDEKAEARPAELSGGEQQRVAVCAALAHRPRLLLADEPTGELDAANASVVYRLISELARAHRCTTLIVSHDPSSAEIADRAVSIRDGRVSEEARARAGDEAIVVGRGGWLRLPEELLARAGISGHARARLAADGVVVSSVEPAAAPTPLRPPARRVRASAAPARVVAILD
jgi:ABC-type lipoprotein export system ATPase subunit